jgi:hypothetical protein
LPDAAAKGVAREPPRDELVDDHPVVLAVNVEVHTEAHEMVVVHPDEVGRDERAVGAVFLRGCIGHRLGADGLGRVDAVGADAHLDLAAAVEDEVEQIIVIADFGGHAHDQLHIRSALVRLGEELVVPP